MDTSLHLIGALLAGLCLGWLLRGALRSKSPNGVKERQSSAEPADSLLLSVNHDLRQPLQALGLFITALRQKKLPDDLAKLAQRIEASHSSFVDDFDALVDMARIDAGRLRDSPSDFLPSELWHRLFDDCASQAERRGQTLRFHNGRRLLRADQMLLLKMLRPLIAASLTASADDAAVLTGIRRRGKRTRVEIWHGAPGMDQATLSLLTSGEVQDNLQKPGLPLRLAHRLARQTGSSIGGCSVSGKGGVVWLELEDNQSPSAK